MKLRILSILFLPLAAAHADTFGSGASTFTMDFIEIGAAGNAADNTTYGSVGYTYRMGVHEVSREMINAYNTLSGGPTLTMNDMSFEIHTVYSPATSISWNEAARFVNWLNTSKGFSAAYQFDTAGFNENIALWEPGDAGYNAANPFRNSNAHYVLPSEDEWYKAAYYDPTKSGSANASGFQGGYWDFATGSDTFPVAVAMGSGWTASGTAVYAGQAGPAEITNAGGLSAYGTMAQTGNVFEWAESSFMAPNESAGENRVLRGGAWGTSGAHSADLRQGASPTTEYSTVGFRVAAVPVVAVPEPSALLLTLIGALGVVTKRRR